MRDNLAGAVWRLAVFVTVCVLGMVALLAVFAQLRFEPENTYRAEFNNVSGLKDGDFVRMAGVEVGKVSAITVQPNAVVLVEFTVNPAAVAMTRALVQPCATTISSATATWPSKRAPVTSGDSNRDRPFH